MPCQWMVVASGNWFVNRARITSPALMRISDAGTVGP